MNTVALFWALCVVCIVNMARYYSSLRALLVVLRGCDPLLYQYVDGSGFLPLMDSPASSCVWCATFSPSAIWITTTRNSFAAVSACGGSLC
ncbi:Universal stress protein B [Sodalis praecaptivus]